MIFHKFPKEVAKMSATNAAASYAESQASKTKMRVGDSRKTCNVAGYRTPEGRLRIAYDLYAPEYPEGCEPGIVDYTAVLRFYPNETHGYDTYAENFRPLEKE